MYVGGKRKGGKEEGERREEEVNTRK